jgi:hypothetical protein
MIYQNNDSEYFRKYHLFYVDTFERYDSLLKSNCNSELIVRIRDSIHNDRIIINSTCYDLENNSSNIVEKDKIVKDLQDEINCTCNNCGKKQANHSVGISYTSICDECYFNINSETDILSVSSYLYFSNSKHINLYPRIGIRFISPNDNFDYAEFGNYFFSNKHLYVITNKIEYKRFDVRKEFDDSIYYNFIKPNYYIIRVIYAGQDTGFEDDLFNRIYTGDFVVTKGYLNKDKDPKIYLKKEKNCMVKSNHNSYEVCGVIASDPNIDFIINDSDLRYRIYKVVLNWGYAYLAHSVNINIIGNIFSNLNRNENIDIWKKSFEIAEYGFQVSDSQVLNLYPFHVFKDYLKSIKTPSFKKTSHKNWFLKFFTQKLTNR